MPPFLPTIILRHRKENLKKCSLSGLEMRMDMQFLTYPKHLLPDLRNYFLLTLEAPCLSEKDTHMGIFLIDGTWKYAQIMEKQLPNIKRRSLPKNLKTSYPRYQTGCRHPNQGLASVEALYAAYFFTGRNLSGLLDFYHWKALFLQKNQTALSLPLHQS